MAWGRVAKSSRVIQPQVRASSLLCDLEPHLDVQILGFHNGQAGTEQAGDGEALPGATWGQPSPGGREGAELIGVQTPREGGSVWAPAAPALVSPLPRPRLRSRQAQISHRSQVPVGVPCSWPSLVSHTSVPWRDHSPDPRSCIFSVGGSRLRSTHPASQKPQCGTRKV